jgi:hypothetical protein
MTRHDKIILEAAKYEQKMAAPPKVKTQEKVSPAHPTPPGDERKEVWVALYGRSPAIIWYLPIGIPVVLYMLYVGGRITLVQWLLTFVIACFPVILRILFMRVWLATGFGYFRHWRKDLPFAISGWEKIVDSKMLQDDCTWARKFTLTVEPDRPTTEDSRNISAYLTVLVKKANKCFYKPESITGNYSGDPRILLKADGYNVSGSANRQVVRVIQRFLRDDLSALERRSHIINKVDMLAGEELFSVFPKPIETDSSGG